MIRSDSDGRLLLFLLLHDGAEMAGDLLRRAWKRASRRGRLEGHLQELENGRFLSASAGGDLDARIFRLTRDGRQMLVGETDPEASWSRSWDGKWRLVLFDVPESQAAVRVRLRRKLRQLRFGWMQNSVWLSPDSLEVIARLFQNDRISVESLVLLEARPVGGESDADMVAGAWDFARLEKLHAAHVKVCRLKPGTGARLSEWLDWVRSLHRSWSEVCRHDPLLPAVLLPAGYRGREAWAAYRTALATAREAVHRLAVRV